MGAFEVTALVVFLVAMGVFFLVNNASVKPIAGFIAGVAAVVLAILLVVPGLQ